MLLTTSGLVTVAYLPLDENIGDYSLLLLASLPACICAAILVAFLPETKDRTYEDVQRALAGPASQCYFDMCQDESERLIRSLSKQSLSRSPRSRYGTLTDGHDSSDASSTLLAVSK